MKDEKEMEIDVGVDMRFFLYLAGLLIGISVTFGAFCFTPGLNPDDKPILAGGAILTGLLSIHAHLVVLLLLHKK